MVFEFGACSLPAKIVDHPLQVLDHVILASQLIVVPAHHAHDFRKEDNGYGKGLEEE